MKWTSGNRSRVISVPRRGDPGIVCWFAGWEIIMTDMSAWTFTNADRAENHDFRGERSG